MKILINTPCLNLLGGVANHYVGLKPHWKENVKYNTVGKRKPIEGSGKCWIIWDLLKFLYKLISFRPDIILLNPSLNTSAIKRDFIFLRLSTFFGFKTAVLIHGFDWDYVKKANHLWLARNLNRASLIYVLAEVFRKEIQNWGVNTKIELQTAKVDDRLIESFNIDQKTGKVENIVYIARVEKRKGVFIALEAYSLLKARFANIRMTIVGGGADVEEVREYIRDKSISDVSVTGRVSFIDIIHEFSNGDLYIFPTCYGEGMPSSVLEAMTFGMPVFTRNVGGLPDFFENGKMGFITDSIDPKSFAEAMTSYILNPELTKKVARNNHIYAKEHFLASKVAESIERSLKKIV